MDIRELVAKARADAAAATEAKEDVATAKVDVAGEAVAIEFQLLPGEAWADITATNPPRAGSKQDSNVGYNMDAVIKDYPLDHVRVDGQRLIDPATGAPDRAAWLDLVSVLSSPARKLLGITAWGLNQLEPHQRMLALGKGSAGAAPKKKRSSPAN